jgi:DUF4097 and DUF4098 domain-containing protein YvlB
MIRAIRFTGAAFLGLTVLGAPLFAKCPISDGGTVIVRAPAGNLQVDTTGRDAVEVQVNSSQVQIKETCGGQTVEVTSNTPAAIQGAITWNIVVPRTVHLDLVAYAGGITVGDSDANVTLRTTGGPVIAGQIKGQAAIITQGGFIKAGNIGSNAELRSQGGRIEVGDVAGNAEFETAGPINAGIIQGRVNAETEGGAISIKEARGDVRAVTQAGDISIGDALRIDARTAGGNITSRRVRGPFQGHTESGDIRLENAAAWVEASTGFGNIVVTLIPENLDGDLHVDLQTGIGDVMIYLPQRMKATVQATVERPAFDTQRIFSDFTMNAVTPTAARGIAASRFLAPLQSQVILNGGGNRVKLHSSLGKIEIKKR